jgi:5-methylcytosine-specific restriction endonuclease McrBC regulatory subunit McrC
MEKKIISGKDCCPINCEIEDREALAYFSSECKFDCFSFSNKEIEEEPIIEFDSRQNQWWANRYVGETSFVFAQKEYSLQIGPRFGSIFLFRLLEEIYNIRLIETKRSELDVKSVGDVIKQIIAFVWGQLLGKANLHGLPKTNVNLEYAGYTAKGKILTGKTIKSIAAAGKLTSIRRIKTVDRQLAGVIFLAYKILRSEYGLTQSKLPDNALQAIQEISSLENLPSTISWHDYKNIKYKDIYLTYKPIVDFSFDIIKRKASYKNVIGRKNQKSYSFFIDVAELWEMYMRSILRKHLARKGWKEKKSREQIYTGRVFERNIIPDIVFEKDGMVIVLDAKYKRMLFFSKEIDREDFFQIHTYAGFYLANGKKALSGLIYPITKQNHHLLDGDFRSAKLYEKIAHSTFTIDGVDLSNFNDPSLTPSQILEMVKLSEEDLLKRLDRHLEIMG